MKCRPVRFRRDHTWPQLRKETLARASCVEIRIDPCDAIRLTLAKSGWTSPHSSSGRGAGPQGPGQMHTLQVGENKWRKPVGVEPTCDTEYRTAGLKPAPSTGQEWLPDRF